MPVTLQIRLDNPMPGVFGGIQIGSGSAGKVEKWITMPGGEFTFHLEVETTGGKLPLRGKAVQKDSKGRFVYIVWRSADGIVSRRAKIYIESISQELLDKGSTLQLDILGRAKDGLPCCATVKPIQDWH